MEITVNEQAQRFYLAFDKWKPAIGHEITVGKYRFCAIPLKENVNVSEVTSGTKIFNIPMNSEIVMLTESKESSIKFLYKIGESLKRIVERTDNLDAHLDEMKKSAFERLGKMPPIENFDTDWILDDVSDVLH
ncbi:hypothetical protein ACFVS2_20590 [Brevibacillus sp. NPDC058079]|uniref:hypothetical protein n=1 Tax=Brevibacillus sp. NPDC058079 TaxID=3346330 RepID=UPI0036E40712